MGAYQLDFVPLDDFAVLPLVLLDDLLGALHLHVVGLVVHWDHKRHYSLTGERAGSHDASCTTVGMCRGPAWVHAGYLTRVGPGLKPRLRFLGLSLMGSPSPCIHALTLPISSIFSR